MSISTSDNSDRSMESAATLQANGLRDSDFEPHLASLQPKPLKTALSKEVQALNLGPTTTCGTEPEPQPFSMLCAINGPFTIRSNGSLGQEILDSDGQTIAWTTNMIVAQVIVELMSGIAMDD